MKGEIEIPGIGSVKVRRGLHIKILSIKMAPGRGVWVNVPYGVSERKVKNFVISQQEWIREHLSKLKVYEKNTGVGLGINTEIKTKFHLLKVHSCDESLPSYRIDGSEIRLFIPAQTSYERVAPYIENFLIEVYRLESRRYLPGRVKELADRYGFRYGKLSFRNNLSNWGSCSGEDNISLNIKLMKLPDVLIDYVILHELCHTIEKNHSDRFWALVKRVCPGYHELRKQLREYNTRI
ncbi:SprT family zinc-dependent metalloprotease [uncultured Sanguibacteroides sp.]|uniref:M48 family metallopeptidase n=1 Tax=uncultured Sanguibacteroides sp. TaxID=1635151 RepID=UPI0025D39917|nr:SprT family zinc-dependent metalloprotease [uncultured Sanguibacteroides sp.]